MLIFISILDSNWAIGKSCKVENKVENNIFANSLIDITIQDDSKRQRSNESLPLCFM